MSRKGARDEKGNSPIFAYLREIVTLPNFQILSPLDFLAEFTQHIPAKGAHLVRYYGWNSNKARGKANTAVAMAMMRPTEPRELTYVDIDTFWARIKMCQEPLFASSASCKLFLTPFPPRSSSHERESGLALPLVAA